MKLLSSLEEIFLLAILNLDDRAYGVTIRREVSRVTGEDWPIGGIYDPLYRLESKGLIESFLSDPTPERGGRSKRMFRIRPEGIEVLVAHKRVRERLWQGVKPAALDPQETN